MYRLIFGHSFTELVALILLLGLAFYFLNKKKAGVHGNAGDAVTGASSSMNAETETNSGRSSSSLTRATDGVSSSSTASTNTFEVFLSFRGLDTRNTFTDHLYNGLLKAGINVFRDNEELRQGKEIGPDLFAAIKNSKILIPILSENYGSSKWCLEELVQIMECKKNDTGHIVLPIFYGVEPAHVRYQKGSFGKAFQERERRERERHLDPTILEKWKQALKEVGNLKGREANGSEANLVELVVQEVLHVLKKKFELLIPENLVGIDGPIEKVMEFVDSNSHATLFVGIYGMGGIGKTTLAKTIYNKISNQFEYCSFIADIRELCERKGLEYLQNQLIFHILKQKDQVHNKDEGTRFISSKFKDKKVLILLDDVHEVNQLKGLAGNHNWFSSGSRIIITTRNKSILDKFGVDHKYEHEKMDLYHSLILFSRHAFRRDSPPSEFEDLSYQVVSTIGGLPLSLEVLGSLLCGKEPKLWSDKINKLRKVPPMEVQKTLRISYDELEYEQQQIFLDIACFFIGTDQRIASYMWDACEFFPMDGIDVLTFMSLIKVGDNQELIMHDQLRDLGRAIVQEENQQEPWNRSRLWDSKEILKVLKKNKGTEKIKAIYLRKGNSKGFGKTANQDGDIHTGEQYKNLTSLRFLKVSGVQFRGDFENSIEELKWLRWHYCPSTFEASNFLPKELVALDLSKSMISDEWQGWSSIMMADKLKFLDLTNCGYLEGTFFLSAFKNLEVLILRGCQRQKRIDSSIGEMKGLVRLDLTECRRLNELPAEMDKLEALEQLILQHCRSISVVPDNIGALQNLEILNISFTKIKELPNGIGMLRKLQDLDASRSSIVVVPKSFNNLFSLQRLQFEGCQNLLFLPELPSNLTYLSITCQSRKLPSLSHLTHLKQLRVIDCKFLECIPELPSTPSELAERSQLTYVEESKLQKSLYNSFKLGVLEIRGCKSMKAVDVSQLKYLESLTISTINEIEMRHFQTYNETEGLFNIEYQNIVEIQGLNRLEFLEELCISGWVSIERLDLPKSKGMRKLNVEFCKNLIEIRGLDWLEFLKELHIFMCASIERLDLSKSKGVKNVIVSECKNLVEIEGLDRLEFLEMLNISRCVSIERLDLQKLKGLKKLCAQDCKSLVEIQGLDKLEFFEELNICGCTSIERLDLRNLKSLKTLYAQNCTKLVEIQSLNRLEMLKWLDISWCTSIERLDLSKFEGLQILKVELCDRLVEIKGLDRLKFLTEINISRCTSMERWNFPKSEGLTIINY